MIEKRFTYFPTEVTSENLTATLTAVGARLSNEDVDFIAERQNPFRQKRGGLSFGAYASIRIPNGKTEMTNINVYGEQAQLSPLSLSITDPVTGTYELTSESGQTMTGGRILESPKWAKERLTSGRGVMQVLQRHGPSNLVGVLGEGRCSLFDTGNACTFCTMKGGEANADREAEEIAEALTVARTTDKRAYNLTVTTGIQSSLQGADALVQRTEILKKAVGDTDIALVVAPFPEKARDRLSQLKDAGVDTLMMPLDVASIEGQKRYTPGKAPLLGATYWRNVKEAVKIFGKGGVATSIIVGLEPVSETGKAIERMADYGVVPEPIPVRWDDSIRSREPLPITNPDDLVAMRAKTAEVLGSRRAEFGMIKAGCSACGGCSGVRINELLNRSE
ncbi:radical SAM protein [Patescibacteria group bacterium]|nr:radical SAM protein [Patescibacteria group bacterium]